MKNIHLVFLSLLLLSAQAEAKVITSTAEGEPPIASINIAAGTAIRINSEGEKTRLKAQSLLFQGETLKTKDETVLEVEFLDGSVLNIGPQSQVILEEFIYDPNMESGKITLKVLSGVYRFSKGKMRTTGPKDIKIKLISGSVEAENATVLGQITGNRSLVILLPPAEESLSIQYQVLVKNTVSGETHETNITKPGFGSIIKDKNFAPTPALKVQENDIAWLNSQFVPPQPKTPEPQIQEEWESDFSIQAIVYDKEQQLGGGKFVVINNQLYEEGAIVQDHEILTIEPDSVKVKEIETGDILVLHVEIPPDAPEEKAEEKVDIASIFYDAQNHQNSFAYINGLLRRETESVGNYTVLEIKPYGVTLQKSGKPEPELVALGKIQPYIHSKEDLSPLLLQSIAYDQDPQKSFATINGRSYRQGEFVEGYPLVRISAEAVWIQGKEKKPAKIPLEKGQEESGDEKPKIELQIILYKDREPQKNQVAINSNLYKAGDLVDGYEILEIHKTYIRVRKRQRLPWRSYIVWTLK